MFSVMRNCVLEFSFQSAKSYADPFNEVELDVVFRSPGGIERVVPAFWAGENRWTVRFSSGEEGRHTYRSVCSDSGSEGLDGTRGAVEVGPYEGSNPLLVHGGVGVSSDKRYLEHADGTPFFWLGDTWWYGLSKRLSWPGDFRLLVADRRAKGFSVIQTVAGGGPEKEMFGGQNANEGGNAWKEGLTSIDPAYFDMADLRIEHIVREGLVPCIFGGWGYHVKQMGTENMKKHWRYLVARYGAYPVVWCLSGEALATWYLSEDKEGDKKWQKREWTEVGKYVREIDGYGRTVTIHPTESGRDQVEDESVLDFDMLQTGHYRSMENTVNFVRDAVARRPRMPVVNGEVSYEGILGTNREEVQRFMFWATILSGGCGHTYGANGLWQFNTPSDPFYNALGVSWGDTPWVEAYQLPGSRQVGIGKGLLERYRWWEFEPHQEWVSDARVVEGLPGPFAAGIPGEVRIIYVARPMMPWMERVFVEKLEAGAVYKAWFFDPVTGKDLPAVEATGDSEGRWEIPQPPVGQDWVVVMEGA